MIGHGRIRPRPDHELVPAGRLDPDDQTEVSRYEQDPRDGLTEQRPWINSAQDGLKSSILCLRALPPASRSTSRLSVNRMDGAVASVAGFLTRAARSVAVAGGANAPFSSTQEDRGCGPKPQPRLRRKQTQEVQDLRRRSSRMA